MDGYTCRRHKAVRLTSAQFHWAIANIHDITTWSSAYRIKDICTFYDLPQRVPVRHYRRFPKLDRVLVALPFFRTIYRLAWVGLGF